MPWTVLILALPRTLLGIAVGAAAAAIHVSEFPPSVAVTFYSLLFFVVLILLSVWSLSDALRRVERGPEAQALITAFGDKEAIGVALGSVAGTVLSVIAFNIVSAAL